MTEQEKKLITAQNRMKKYMGDTPLIDGHVHLFDGKDIDENFLPFIKTSQLINSNTPELWLRSLLPFTNNDILDRFALFVESAKYGIDEKLNQFQQINGKMKMVVLPMDFNWHRKGKPPVRPYANQIKELIDLKNKYPGEVIVFGFLDPRNPNMFQDMKKDLDKGVEGFKIYPKLGYYPNDSRFDRVYAFLERKNIPIVSHGAKVGVYGHKMPSYSYFKRYYKGKMIVPKIAYHLMPDIVKSCYCNHPMNFIPVLKEYPKLKISMAHFGGDAFYGDLHKLTSFIGYDNWSAIIAKMIIEYPNFFTDVSYMQEEATFNLVLRLMQDKIAKKKIVYGSDWFMITKEKGINDFYIDQMIKRPKMMSQLMKNAYTFLTDPI